ncbi:unnamed protein product [Ilex paraguariensis]|uniref:Replication protein A C-terminal domain-containing protein n=1 Tax=Ilex paraguariensis TaxID=185542 RepID=A0ABC8QYW9_9AQUA
MIAFLQDISCVKFAQRNTSSSVLVFMGGVCSACYQNINFLSLVVTFRPVMDYNQIAYHFVESIYVHLHNTKSRTGVPTSAHMPSSSLNTPSKGYQAAPPNQFSGHYSIDGLKDIDKKVMDYLQQPQCLIQEKGVHRDELAQRLSIPLEKILEAIRSLEEEGLIYSTIDECHFKSTVNG